MAIPGDGGNVVIKIKFNVDDKSLAAAQAKIKALSGESGGAAKDLTELSGAFDDLSKDSDRAGKSIDNFNKRLGDNDKKLGGATRGMKGMRMAMKGLLLALVYVTAEWWLMVAAIGSVNGLLWAGQALMKTYQWLMKGVAYAAGAATVAVGLLTAAQREYNASLVSFRYTSAPHMGSGTNQAMSALRMLTSDTKLAVFGMESLNATFAAVSQSTEMTGPLKQALRGLGDFAVAAGGDIGKNLAGIGSFLGQLQKSGSLTDEVVAAAGQVGGKFAESIDNAKKMGITSADALMKMFSSGEFAKIAGLEGALDAVNNTLMGKFKTFFTQIQTQFADFGQAFLPQTKATLDGLASIFRVNFTRIAATVMAVFGDGTLMKDILNVFGRLADFTANVLDKYLPQTGGFFDAIKTTISVTLELFYKLRNSLQRFSDAGKVVTDALGPVVKTIGSGFAESFRNLGEWLTSNRSEFIEFGDALAGAFDAIRSGIELIKEAWQAAMPTLTSVLRIFSQVFGGIAEAGRGILSFFGGGGPGVASDNMQSQNPFSSTLGGVQDVAQNFGGVGVLALGAMGLNALNARRGKPGGVFSRMGGILNRGVGGMAGGMGRYMPKSMHELRHPIQNARTAPGGVNSLAGKPAPPGLMGRLGTAAKYGTGYGKALGGVGAFPAVAGQLAMLGLQAQGGGGKDLGIAAMTAGGLLSFINPALGLGVSGAGTAIGADNPFKGAAAGAMSGAAFGSMIAPGVGTAIGAGIGTVVGGTSGLVRQQGIGLSGNDADWKNLVAAVTLPFSMWNDAHMRDLTSDRARNAVEATASEVAQLALTEGTDSARKRLDELNSEVAKMTELEKEFSGKSQEERKAMADDLARQGEISEELRGALSERYMGTFADETREANDELQNFSKVALPELDRKLENLSRITGVTEEQLAGMASTMGVNLFDGTMSTVEALEALGLATVKTAEQINGALREIYAIELERLFGDPLRAYEATETINQAGEEFRQLGPGIGEPDRLRIMRTIGESALLRSGGNPLEAGRFLREEFGPGGNQYKTGPGRLGPFAGAPESVGAELGELGTNIGTYGAALTATNFQTAIATGSNLQMSMEDQARLQQALIAGMDNPEAGKQLENTLAVLTATGQIRGANGDILTGQAAGDAIAGALEPQITALIGARGAEKPGITFEDMAAKDAEAAAATRTAIEEGGERMSELFGQKVNEIMNGQPTWWANEPTWYPTAPLGFQTAVESGMTASMPAVGNAVVAALQASGVLQPADTPTSRLARTMGRHNFYDSQLSGKRTVTSSWRNWGLGSINSDHVTGNAYDLTGQNLGAYSTMVNRMGGFAEFHGVGGNRHLHVVPGQTPTGDTVAPIPTAAIAVGGGGSTAYNITINSAQGQDPNAIAAAVMARIDDRDRNMRERR